MKLDAPGLYALEPSAFGVDQMVDLMRSCAPAEVRGNVAIVTVRGLLTYSGAVSDGPAISYADIVRRVREAYAGPTKPHTVVLHLGSPGGDVAGAFDSARLIRAAVPQGGRLVAYTDSCCCSAAYALACGADDVAISSTAIVGSVGVIRALKTTAAAEKALGVATTLVTSGARKADGNPSTPLTPEALAAIQSQVDTMAAEFFRLVGESRGDKGLTAEAAQALEAGAFVGHAAVATRLADRVVDSLDSLVAELQSPPSVLPQAKFSSEERMPDDKKDEKKEDATRASLVTASGSDDPEKAARAKRALAAYDSDEEKEDEKAVAAASDDDKEKDSASAQAVTSLAAQVQKLSADLQARDARDAAAASDAFFASCAHVDADLLKTLKTLPLAQAKDIVAKLPTVTPATLAATATVVAGAGQTDAQASRLAPEAKATLDRQMGLGKVEFGGVTETPYRQTFGAVVVK